MKLLKVFTIWAIAFFTLQAQNADSLFNSYLEMHGIKPVEKLPQIQSVDDGRKCGFGVAQQLHENYNQLTASQQQQFDILASRPEMQASIVSPSGIFRIHYDSTGNHRPTYFDSVYPGDPSRSLSESLSETAIAFDSSYNYEINILGYPPHVSDGDLGGGPELDVYLRKMGNLDYGVTNWNNNGAAYITVNSDFSGGQYTKGIDAVRVTAAHEYHHAIQVGNYGFFSSETYFYEITSTSMEEFVYDDVNDYYGYQESYFWRPHTTFTGFSGYDLANWHIYLVERFEQEGSDTKGFDIIKRCWELMEQNENALESIKNSIAEHGSSLGAEFNRFGIWNYFTAHRAQQGMYFSEGANYPVIRPIKVYGFTPPSESNSLSSEPVSNNYLVYDLFQSTGFNDTLATIITNYDVDGSKQNPDVRIDYNYTLYDHEAEGSRSIMNGFYSKLESNRIPLLSESNIYNDAVANGGTITRMKLDYAYPQPFRYSDNFIRVPVDFNQTGYANLNVYTAGMNLAYSGRHEIFTADKIVVHWDGLDNGGNKLPTGVYIFVTESDEQVTKGKLVIFNE